MGSREDRCRFTHVVLHPVGCSTSQGQALPAGEVPGQLAAMPAPVTPALGTEKAQAAWGFGERDAVLSILLSDLVREVTTLTSPPPSSTGFCTHSPWQNPNS